MTVSDTPLTFHFITSTNITSCWDYQSNIRVHASQNCKHLNCVEGSRSLPDTSALCMAFSFDLCGPRLGHGTVSKNMVLSLVGIAICVMCV